MSRIKMTVAAVLAASAATSAFALDASAGLATGTVIINIGGSTAIDNTLLNAEVALTSLGGVCTAGTIDVYQIGAPTNRLTYCTGASGLPTGLAGQPLAFFKESNVGSFNGPGSLVGKSTTVPASGYQLLFLNAGQVAGTPSALTATNCATVTTSNLGADFNPFTLHTCSATATNIQVATNVTGGIADVEANILKDPNGVFFPANLLGNLKGLPGLDVVWGVPVTKNLFYALQSAEGLTSTCPSGNLDSPTCAPSLSRPQVASLYQAVGLNTWTQILGLNNPGGDNNIYLCRRDDGSGTEASFEAYFLGARCGGATNPSGSKLVMPAEDGTFVFTQGSTGNVRSCLQAFFGGGSAKTFAGVATTEPGNQWAIGILSSEVTAGNLAAANGCNDCFRLVAIDGVLPTLENTVNGFYPYWSSDVFYTTTTGPDAATGAPLAGFNLLQAKMGSPTFTAITNTTFQNRPWGSGGDLSPAAVFEATNPPTIPATNATVNTNPTNAFTKASSGNVSNCDVPVLFNNTTTPLNTPPEAKLLGSGTVNN